ncbi:hypothetical protein RND71_007526 [Anisodus tanguticus]|uniref:Alpha-N-acetylglucosaminidase C-terminal domain-containing protein n=1 Tax=Anisodus tanguticus TaxID=243964 RepID=A0AAE1VK73_9SOLA|nr:hypothetical protein RND71_007526 [Anisodus tanguticus]
MNSDEMKQPPSIGPTPSPTPWKSLVRQNTNVETSFFSRAIFQAYGNGMDVGKLQDATQGHLFSTNKFWSDLLGAYYLPRASMYFNLLSKSLEENVDFKLEEWRKSG